MIEYNICRMEYNINQLTDYLAELTGCEVKRLANGDLNYDQLPLAIESCYTLCDIEFLGTNIDPEKNKVRGEEIILSDEGSKVVTMVVPTNEELAIARETVRLV